MDQIIASFLEVSEKKNRKELYNIQQLNLLSSVPESCTSSKRSVRKETLPSTLTMHPVNTLS